MQTDLCTLRNASGAEYRGRVPGLSTGAEYRGWRLRLRRIIFFGLRRKQDNRVTMFDLHSIVADFACMNSGDPGGDPWGIRGGSDSETRGSYKNV